MGTIIKTEELSVYPSSYDQNNTSYASISSSQPLTNAYTSASSTTYAQINLKTGSNAETYVYFKFDFSSIPEGATITRVTASAKGYISTTTTSRISSRQMQLAAGTTLKGSALTIGTSASEQLFASVGTWTRQELLDAGIRFYVKRGTSNTTTNYYIRAYGATMSVEYSWQATTYSITVTNGEPASAEVESGDSFTASYPHTEKPTCTDNNVDVTNQLVYEEPMGPFFELKPVLGTNYTFALNGNNYYESNNKAVSNSAALCTVNIFTPVEATVTFSLINYAEATYDYGLLSNVDTMLSTSASADSSGVYWNGKNNNSANVRTVTYTVSAGDHFICVKFFKDGNTNSNNDSLQFKVSISANEPYSTDPSWTYTIASVGEAHTIVFIDPVTSILYFKQNGSWVQASKAYKKVNGAWVEQTDPASVFSAGTNYVKG